MYYELKIHLRLYHFKSFTIISPLVLAFLAQGSRYHHSLSSFYLVIYIFHLLLGNAILVSLRSDCNGLSTGWLPDLARKQ